MNYFGLFVDLPEELESFIYEEKEKIKEISISQYVYHPPHITLATFLEPYEEIFDDISFKPTHIFVDKKDFFCDEDQNYTLYFNIRKNPSLIDLHYQIVKRLNERNINLIYPYIGPDWKAHITVGQIKNKKSLEQFLNEKYKIETTVDRLSYIKYKNEKHLTLKERKYC
jgi:2'-5' RNA ligase